MSAAPASFATDLYPPGTSFKDAPLVGLPLLWQGFYAGGHLGGAWSVADVGDSYTYYGDPAAKTGLKSAGLIGGAQIGYNYQLGSLVLGLEGDLGSLSISGREAVGLATPGPYGLRASYSVDGGFYGDITARAGYALGATLFYVKGGAAYVNADFKADYTGENCSTSARHCGIWGVTPDYARFTYRHDSSSWGWTLGGGVEYALNSNWSLKVEYQHFDFGGVSYSYKGEDPISGTPGLASTLSGRTKVSLTADAVKLGVSFRFGPAGGF